MSLTTPLDPRTIWPLAYLSGRLGYHLASYGVDGPRKDVISADLVRDDEVRVHLDWFPRTEHVIVSQGPEIIAVVRSFAELADVLEDL